MNRVHLFFAFGLKEIHSLKLWKLEKDYALELWYGKVAEEEVLKSKPKFSTSDLALKEAKLWLERDVAL